MIKNKSQKKGNWLTKWNVNELNLAAHKKEIFYFDGFEWKPHTHRITSSEHIVKWKINESNWEEGKVELKFVGKFQYC